MQAVDSALKREMHRWLVWSRLLDQRLNQAFRAGKLMSMFHGTSGQEAADVGAALALQEHDAVVPHYRHKALHLMRGMDPDDLVAGAFGKKEGFGQGRTMTGSHMMGQRDKGLIPAQGGVGGAVATGTGAALAFRVLDERQAVLIWQGDGGANRGDVHESMNLASVMGLPAVFYFVNNGWGLSVPSDYSLSVERISDRAAAYDMPGVTIDGSDPVTVYETVSEALDRARRDRQPSLVEVMVRRAGPHSVNDPDLYRSEEERELDEDYDVVERFETSLVDEGVMTAAEAEQVWEDVRERIREAVDYADSCSEPDVDDLLSAVYADDRNADVSRSRGDVSGSHEGDVATRTDESTGGKA